MFSSLVLSRWPKILKKRPKTLKNPLTPIGSYIYCVKNNDLHHLEFISGSRGSRQSRGSDVAARCSEPPFPTHGGQDDGSYTNSLKPSSRRKRWSSCRRRASSSGRGNPRPEEEGYLLLLQGELCQHMCLKFMMFATNGVPVARHLLILSQNEAYGVQEGF